MSLPDRAERAGDTHGSRSHIRSVSPTPARVGLLLNSFHPIEGGAERQLRQVMEELVVRGWHVSVVTRPVEGTPTRERRNGLDIRRTPSLLPHVPAQARRFSYFAAAVSTLRTLRPDILVSSQLDATSLSAGLYAASAGKIHIVRIAGGAADETGAVAGDLQQISRGARGRLIRAALKRPNCHVVSPARHLTEHGLVSGFLSPERTHIIPNGVANARFITNPQVLPTSNTTAVWYGRDDPVKNVPAFQRLVETCTDITFASIGAATLPALPNLIQHGWIPEPGAVIGGSRVAVSTSLFEGRPNFLLQALALGLRVVAFDIPATRELAEDYPGRIALVQMGDADALGAAVRSSASAPRLARAAVPSMSDAAAAWSELLDWLRTGKFTSSLRMRGGSPYSPR